MLMINISVIIMFSMLAIISRKHYSKYKDRKVMAVFYGMADTLFKLLQNRISTDSLKIWLRKTNVVSPKRLGELTTLFIKKIIAVCLVVLFLTNCITLAAIAAGNNEQQIILSRDGYSGSTKTYAVKLLDQKKDITLEVFPVEYTREEFNERADAEALLLEQSLLGENTDAEHITSDLYLARTDEKNEFGINWSSDVPSVITSSGRVNTAEAGNGALVNLTARISYLEYENEYNFAVVVVKPEEKLSSEERLVSQALSSIESENRNEKTIILPHSVEGVDIALQENKKTTTVQLFFLGIVACIVIIVLSINRLKEAGRVRDEQLMAAYPEFVDRLALLLGAGMTIYAGIKQIILENGTKRDYLTNELEYTINQIEAGAYEAECYEELGNRLGLPAYSRLMNYISRNLRMGAKDLLKQLRNESEKMLEVRRELARKKGEVASSRLLFPMIILMAVVLLIVIIPAVIKF